MSATAERDEHEAESTMKERIIGIAGPGRRRVVDAYRKHASAAQPSTNGDGLEVSAAQDEARYVSSQNGWPSPPVFNCT